MPKKIFCLFLLILSNMAQADRTMISNVSEIGNLNVYTSWFTATTNNNAENTVIPCAGSACSYGLILYYENGTSIDFNGRTVPVSAGMTWGMANRIFVSQFGATGATSWQWNWRPSQWDVCVGAIPANKGQMALSRPISIYSSPCTPVPPSNVQCSVSGDANIVHGTLSPAQVNGHTANASVQLSCTRATTVTIEVASPDIDLGGGVKSRVSVTNGNRISVSRPTTLNLQSILSGTAPTAGQHSGSTIVVFNIA